MKDQLCPPLSTVINVTKILLVNLLVFYSVPQGCLPQFFNEIGPSDSLEGLWSLGTLFHHLAG